MIDFDNFKEINDLEGHLTCDEVLKRFTSIEQKYIHKGDIIGRYCGEEFIFIFRNAHFDEALPIIQRIQLQLKSYFQNSIQ